MRYGEVCTVDSVSRVGVVGGGAAARAFAAACGRAGVDVVTEAAGAAAFADRELVLEVPGRVPAGPDRYAALDAVVADDAVVFAPAADTLPLVQLCRATRRPGRVVGVRFVDGNTAELTASLLTEHSATEYVDAFLGGVLGVRTVRADDPSACGVNAALLPHLLAAVRMYESGMAAADVDHTVRLSLTHPAGPLRLIDRVGPAAVAAVARALRGSVPAALTRLAATGGHFHGRAPTGLRAAA